MVIKVQLNKDGFGEGKMVPCCGTCKFHKVENGTIKCVNQPSICRFSICGKFKAEKDISVFPINQDQKKELIKELLVVGNVPKILYPQIRKQFKELDIPELEKKLVQWKEWYSIPELERHKMLLKNEPENYKNIFNKDGTWKTNK